MGHRRKIKLKTGLNNKRVNTIDGLATITKNIYIMYTKFCFVHVILIANQAASEKNPTCHY